MTKLKQFSHRFHSLYSKENNLWVGGVQCLTIIGALFLGDLEQEGVL